jgi:hypothetical protein
VPGDSPFLDSLLRQSRLTLEMGVDEVYWDLQPEAAEEEETSSWRKL